MAGAEIGIFGGSGFYSFLDEVEEVELETEEAELAALRLYERVLLRSAAA